MKRRFFVVVFSVVVFLISRVGFAGVNVWTPFGPEGIEVFNMAADPSSPGTFYLGCRNGEGVYKTTDGGLNWGPPMHNGLPLAKILAIAVNPRTPGEVYVATDDLEIYITTDGGWNWALASADVTPSSATQANLVFADDPTPRVYWSWSGSTGGETPGGIFMREEGGFSWTAIDAGLGGLAVYRLAYAPEDPPFPATLYAGLRNGDVFRSEDSGDSWINLNIGLNQAYAAVAVDPSNPSTVYANARNQYVFRSDNRGATWTAVSDVPRGMSDLWVHPTDHSVFGIGRNGFGSTPTWRTNLFRSVDGGVSWENLTPEMYGAKTIAFSAEPGTELYAAIENGIWAYPAGFSETEWEPRMGGLRAHNVVSFAFAPSNPAFLYAGTSFTGIYRSSDGGSTFEPIVDGLVNRVGSQSIAVDPLDCERVYSGGQTANSLNGIGHDFLISSDAGTTWQSVPNQDPAISWWRFTNSVGVDAVNPSRIMVSSGYFPAGALRSVDGGATFQEMDSGFEGCVWLNKITITPGVVFGGCDTGVGGPVLFKSTDDGLTWTPCSLGLEGQQGAEIVAVDPFDPENAFVGTWEGVFRTDADGLNGCTWEFAGSGLPDGYVTDIVFDPDVPGTAYACVDGGGVFRTVDGGDTWEPMNTGLDLETARRVWNLSIDLSDSKHLVAGTSHGLFELSVEALDDDGDGVLGSVEDANPDGPDGNGDGIDDSSQRNVASLPSTEGPYVTIASPEGTRLAGVQAMLPSEVLDPPPGEATFPLGMLEYSVSGLIEGGNVDVVLYLPPGILANSFWKFNATLDNFAPHWYEFTYDGETGAEIFNDRLVLHFVDGQRGDDDLMANAVIAEPGAPSLVGRIVAVDVMPGGEVNPINLTSRGMTPVAVLTTGDFDAKNVDPETVVLAGATPIRWAWEDVDSDGNVDLIMKFQTQEFNLTVNSTRVVLVARTLGGAPIWGSDIVRTLP